MAKLKVGIIGGGHIVTHRHLPVFRKIENVEVVAICDKNEQTAKKVAKDFAIDHSYSDLSAMLKENLDVVDVCTPIQIHAQLAMEAMESGCHVLSEKPLAMTVEDVDRMYETADKKHVKLCVVHQNIFNPVVRKAKRLVDEGAVGDLISVDVGTSVTRDYQLCLDKNHWSHKLPGGIFFETIPHPVYLLQLFLGNIEPTCVIAERLHFSWMKADEIRVLIKGKKTVGSLMASCNPPFHTDTLNIVGTKLGLQIDLWARSMIKYGRRTEDPYSIGMNTLGLAWQSFGLVGTTAKNALIMATGGIKVSAHYGFIQEFVNSVINDTKPPVSRNEARETVRVVAEICNAVDKISQPSEQHGD
jgi:predicted dehydrogenase